MSSYHVIRMVDTLEGTSRAVKTQHDGHGAPSLACGQLHNSSFLAHGKAFPLPSWRESWGHAPSVCAQQNATAKSLIPATIIIHKKNKPVKLSLSFNSHLFYRHILKTQNYYYWFPLFTILCKGACSETRMHKDRHEHNILPKFSSHRLGKEGSMQRIYTHIVTAVSYFLLLHTVQVLCGTLGRQSLIVRQSGWSGVSLLPWPLVFCVCGLISNYSLAV
jgi:hypothetical protein